MADDSPLSEALARAGQVFALAYALGQEFQREHQQPGPFFLVVGGSPRERHRKRIDEFAAAALGIRNTIENPPQGFEAVAENLRGACELARRLSQTTGGDVLSEWPHLNQMGYEGHLAVKQAVEAMSLKDPWAFLDEFPGGEDPGSEHASALEGDMPDPSSESDAPLFTGDLDRMRSLSDWFDDFDRASVCRVDGYNPDSPFVVDSTMLNTVLAHGSEHLGCLNIVEAQKLSQLIGALQRDTAYLVAGGLEAAVDDPSEEVLAACHRWDENLEKATLYIRWLGHKLRDELRSLEKELEKSDSSSAASETPTHGTLGWLVFQLTSAEASTKRAATQRAKITGPLISGSKNSYYNKTAMEYGHEAERIRQSIATVEGVGRLQTLCDAEGVEWGSAWMRQQRGRLCESLDIPREQADALTVAEFGERLRHLNGAVGVAAEVEPVGDSGNHQAVANTLVGPNREYPNPPTYARDKWIYDNMGCNSFRKLQLELKKVASRERFEVITSRYGMKKAADRYADYHQLPKRRFSGDKSAE